MKKAVHERVTMRRQKRHYTLPRYWSNEEGKAFLCIRGLREYFNLPRGCKSIDLVISSRYHKDAYAVGYPIDTDFCYFLPMLDLNYGMRPIIITPNLKWKVTRLMKESCRTKLYLSIEVNDE